MGEDGASRISGPSQFRASAADHAIGLHRSNLPVLPAAEAATFQGIRRADGGIATRNYIGVLTTVNCSAQVARLISDHFPMSGELKSYPNVDGVVALTHKSGCAGGDEGEGEEGEREAGFHDVLSR